MIRNLFKVSIWISLASLISRGLGLYREHLLSKIFGGISDNLNVLDSYYIAFRIPDFIYNIILLGVGTAVLVPLYTHIKKNSDELSETFWTINIVVSAFILTLSILAYIFMPQLLTFIFFSHDPRIIQISVQLSRIMIISPIFFTVSTLIGSFLQSHRIYIFSQFSPILYNIGIVLGITYLFPIYGVSGLAYGVALGAILHAGIQIPWLFGRLPKIKFGNLGLTNLTYCFKQTAIRGLTLASGQLNLFIDSILTGFLASGSLSLYNWTQNVYYLPIGIVPISLSIPALTYFSEFERDNDEKSLRNGLSRISIMIFGLGVFASIFMYFESTNISSILFNYGNFAINEGINLGTMTGALQVLSLSLPFQFGIPIFIRFSYARKNMKIPLYGGLIAILTNTIIGLYLVIIAKLGILGLAIALSISSIVQYIYYALNFHKYIDGSRHGIQKIIIFGLILLFIISTNHIIFENIYIQLSISTVITSIFYIMYLKPKKLLRPY